MLHVVRHDIMTKGLYISLKHNQLHFFVSLPSIQRTERVWYGEKKRVSSLWHKWFVSLMLHNIKSNYKWTKSLKIQKEIVFTRIKQSGLRCYSMSLQFLWFASSCTTLICFPHSSYFPLIYLPTDVYHITNLPEWCQCGGHMAAASQTGHVLKPPPPAVCVQSHHATAHWTFHLRPHKSHCAGRKEINQTNCCSMKLWVMLNRFH